MLKYSDKDKILGFVTSFALFVLVSAPSIKILYSHPIINMIPLALFLFVFAIIIRNPLGINVKSKEMFIILFSFTLIFYVYYLFPKYSYRDEDNFFKYFYFFSVLFLVLALNRLVNVGFVLNLLVFWAVCIASLKLTGNLHLNAAKGQHYLTAGLPMGVGLTIVLMKLTKIKKNIFRSILYIVAFLIIISALLISRGRSSLLYPFIILFLFFFTSILYNKKKRKQYVIGVMMIFIAILIAYTKLETNEDYRVFKRVDKIVENTDEESRYFIWKTAYKLIIEQPLGYGVDSYHYLLPYYPHNIFLETTLSLGVMGLVVLCLILGLFFRGLRSEIINVSNHQIVEFGFAGLFFFLAWNSSFDLATAYIPLSMLILFYLKSSFEKKRFSM